MADAIRDIVMRLSLEIKEQIKAPDLSQLTGQVQKLDKQAKEAAANIAAASKATAAGAATMEKPIVKATQQLDEIPVTLRIWREEQASVFAEGKDGMGELSLSSTQLVSLMRQQAQAQSIAATSMGDISRGAFAAARGMAFLGGASDKGLQSLVRMVATVQGAGDAARGVMTAVAGLSAAKAFQRAVSAGATAEEASYAAALARSNIQLKAATLSTKALTAAKLLLNPVVAASVVVLGALYFAYKRAGDAAEEAGKKERDAFEKRRELSRKNQELADKLAENVNRVIRFDASTAFGGADAHGGLANLVGGQAGLDALDEAQKKLEAFQASLNRRNIDFRDGEHGANAKSELEIAKQHQAVEQALIANQRQRLDLQRQTTNDKLKELDTTQRIAEQAKAILDRQEQAKASFAERVGRLAPHEQRELERLSEKLAAGDTSDGDVRRIEDLVGRTQATGEAFQRQAVIDSSRVGSNLGAIPGISAADQAVVDQSHALAQEAGVDDFSQLIQHLAEKRQEASDTLRELAEGDIENKRLDIEVMERWREVQREHTLKLNSLEIAGAGR